MTDKPTDIAKLPIDNLDNKSDIVVGPIANDDIEDRFTTCICFTFEIKYIRRYQRLRQVNLSGCI